jgi:drug/metabolite transporter (DMT)-like permease
MYASSNTTPVDTITPPRGHAREGLALCALAVFAFSFTLPATRIAAREIDPLLIGLGRGALAGLCALPFLLVRGERLVPERRYWKSLAVVALGVVLAFPLLTAFALRVVPAHHAVLVIALGPLFTSVFAAARSGERPTVRFWLFALLGACAVFAYGADAHGLTLSWPDGWLLAAVVLVAAGYAEGGKLAGELGGTRVICWALMLTLPLTLGGCLLFLAVRGQSVPSLPALGSFAFIAIVCTLLAFCAWYRGLALGGVAHGSQVQLLQPMLSLLWCASWLAEPLAPSAYLAGLTVIACAIGTRHSASHRRLDKARSVR